MSRPISREKCFYVCGNIFFIFHLSPLLLLCHFPISFVYLISPTCILSSLQFCATSTSRPTSLAHAYRRTLGVLNCL